MDGEEFIPGYAIVRAVPSWEAFVATPLGERVNGVVWRRELSGAFDEVLRLAGPPDGVEPLDEALLSSRELSAQGRLAAAEMLLDLERLRALGHEPGIERVEGYPRDTDEIANTDVYSFHVDSATVPTETFLCTYAGRASEGLRLDEARRIVDVPAARARLQERFFGEASASSEAAESDRFEAYLRESHLDLHYAPLPGAQPFSFGVGNLWRLAVQYPGAPAPAFIHRAPEEGRPPAARLLLIS